MIHGFDKQVADSISREGAKLIRTLLPDEDSSSTEYRYNLNCKNTKEIHFYKDGLIESCYGWYLTHNSTIEAIDANNPRIYTTAISALDFSYLLDKGYKIFLHENGKVGEIHEGSTELTNKEIRKVHDIRRLWIGGGFQEYFYNE